MIRPIVWRLERVGVAMWRWVALAYFATLTTGTHWPGLRVGAPGPIPVDKILHALAFCGLAGLLMLTRLLDRASPRAFGRRNIWRAAAAALALAAIDEITQALPGANRFPGWDGFAADALGIAIALMVAMFAFRPVALPAPPA